MKKILLALIFVPVFLFAQEESQEFVVKKSSIRLFYMTDTAYNLYGRNQYLWIGNKKVLWYENSNTPEAEYDTNTYVAKRLLSDNSQTYTYSINKDTIVFSLSDTLTGDGKSYFTQHLKFYPSGEKWVLTSIFSSTTRPTIEQREFFTEFIPIKKK